MPVTIGYIPGCWDLLHVGHVHMLERAASLCDRLIVGVPSDDVVCLDKGVPPVITLHHRMKVVESLACVDCAIPYFALEFTTHLNMIQPDILFVGTTWGAQTRHVEAESWIQRNGRRIIQLPYYGGESTTEIKKRIRGH